MEACLLSLLSQSKVFRMHLAQQEDLEDSQVEKVCSVFSVALK